MSYIMSGFMHVRFCAKIQPRFLSRKGTSVIYCFLRASGKNMLSSYLKTTFDYTVRQKFKP
jgi:hypothetical protein